MYDIKTSISKFLFIPVLVFLLANLLYIALCMTVVHVLDEDNVEIFTCIYLASVCILNVLSMFIILYLVIRYMNKNIVDVIDTFYLDMQDFYKSNQDGVTSWSQRIIVSPKEISELSKYFHNNIARKISDLSNIVNHDPLTGLKTDMTLRADLAKYENHVIAVINISNFKEINSFYGTELADEILSCVASMLRNYFSGENYFLYRIYGDDFAVLWPNYTDRNLFIDRLNNFLEYLGKKEVLVGGYTHINLAATIGIAFSYDSSKYSMVNAFMALHHSKEYKNPIVVYNKNLPTLNVFKKNIKYTEIIYHALKNQDLIPFYQPIQALNDNNQDGKRKYEALMRIKDKDGQIVPPIAFLDIAKRSNAYLKLSKLMIEKSFAMLATKSDAIFSVNLSLEDMSSPDFSTWFMDMIIHYNLEGRVVVEITEQDSIEDFDSVSNFVANVKDMGIKIALDDFGSGYSNFSVLMQLKVNYLKIDGSLIKNIDTDENAKIIVETIARFAKLLNIYTIAEFVSSKEVYDVIKEIGIDYAQGYYIGQPEATI